VHLHVLRAKVPAVQGRREQGKGSTEGAELGCFECNQVEAVHSLDALKHSYHLLKIQPTLPNGNTLRVRSQPAELRDSAWVARLGCVWVNLTKPYGKGSLAVNLIGEHSLDSIKILPAYTSCQANEYVFDTLLSYLT